MRDEFDPVGSCRIVDRADEHAVVASALGGAEVEGVAAVLDVVLDIGLAGGEQLGQRSGIEGVEVVDFATGRAVHLKEEESAAAALVDREMEPLIGFFVQQRIRSGAAEQVPPGLIRALGVIERDVDEAAAVLRPFEPVVGIRNGVRRHFSGGKVLHLGDVDFVAGGIEGVGQQAVIGAGGDVAQAQIALVLGQQVEVEHDLLGGIERAVLAAVDRILQALDGARVVEEAAVGYGCRRVGLLDTPEHLLVELLAQVCGGAQRGLGVGVLRFEVGDGVGIVAVAQPEVRIDAGFAVLEDLFRDALGDRKNGFVLHYSDSSRPT